MRVLMQFHYYRGWNVSFLEEDCKTVLEKHLVFRDPAKIITMLKLSYRWTLEDVQSVERGIETGRGAIWIHLDWAKYRKLRER